ncbi:MAG: FemAB family protein [Anaerolineaceae bacterium]|nr:MAG: FemAB family protein [Anaerolineaceae bacterium]
MPEIALPEWNNYLSRSPDAHLLQTGEWGELKRGFGWEPVRVAAGDCGAQILFRRLPMGLTVAYIPKGPVYSEQCTVSSEQFWGEVDAVCRARRAVFLKVEPDAWEDALTPTPLPKSAEGQMRASAHSIQPRRTILVDLRGSEDEILARMKQKCRYNIRLAEKKGVTVRPWTNVDGFHKMMTVTGARDEFGVHSLEYYRRAHALLHGAGLAELLVAEYEGKPLAALMACARGKSAWYLYGASTDEERNRMPAYLIQWEAMRWAKARGAEMYDLWGVPDEDESALEAGFESRSDGLWGVYRFKRGFGGAVKRSAQARDKVYHPLLYRAYLAFLRGRE